MLMKLAHLKPLRMSLTSHLIYIVFNSLFISKLLFFFPYPVYHVEFDLKWTNIVHHCFGRLLSFLLPGDSPAVSKPEESLRSGVPRGAGPSAYCRGTAWGACSQGSWAWRWGSRHKVGVEWGERSSGNEEISLGECQTDNMVKASVPLSLVLRGATGKAQPKWTGCLGLHFREGHQ